MITIDEERGHILLSTGSSSYALALVEGALPSHLHWGSHLSSTTGLESSAGARRAFPRENRHSFGTVKQ